MGANSEPATGTKNKSDSNTQNRTVTETPIYDCDDVDRPDLPSPNADPPGEYDRYTYPQRPEFLSDESAVLTYVKGYERAYRLNDLYSQHGNDLDSAGVFIQETWAHETTNAMASGRLKYQYGYSVDQDDGQVEADSSTIYASYYTDEKVVLRAVESGYKQDESKLSPGPIEQGIPTECF